MLSLKTDAEVEKIAADIDKKLVIEPLIDYCKSIQDAYSIDDLKTLVKIGHQIADKDGGMDAAVLRKLMNQHLQGKSLSTATIAKAVARKMGVKLTDLRGSTRQAKIVRARGIAILLSRKLTSLSLQQIGGQTCQTVAIVVIQRRAERRHGNAHDRGRGHHGSPRFLRVLDSLFKEPVHQQIFQLGIVVESFLDAVEEHGADDAAAAPQQRAVAVVQIPLMLIRCGLQLNESLGVADNFRGVQGLPDIVDKRLRTHGCHSLIKTQTQYPIQRRFFLAVLISRAAGSVWQELVALGLKKTPAAEVRKSSVPTAVLCAWRLR